MEVAGKNWVEPCNPGADTKRTLHLAGLLLLKRGVLKKKITCEDNYL
jgi:hypothetical protein